jgi:hypothetical protein
MKILPVLLGTAVGCLGQTFEIRDRTGIPVIMIQSVKMVRYSEYFKTEIPTFQAIVQNISGEKLFNVVIVGLLHMKDRSIVKFRLDARNDLPKNFTYEANGASFKLDGSDSVDAGYVPVNAMAPPWPLKPADFDSVEFYLGSAQRYTTHDGLRVSGFIAKDEGCFTDYLATKSLTGVTLRKKLVELIQYGCGFVIEEPQMAIILANSQKAFGVGNKRVTAVRVMLSDEGQFLLGVDAERHTAAAHWGETGWILSNVPVRGHLLGTEDIGISK